MNWQKSSRERKEGGGGGRGDLCNKSSFFSVVDLVACEVHGGRFESSELGPPPLRPQESVAPPPLGSKGGDTLACGGGSGGTNSDEESDTMVLYVQYAINPLRVWGDEGGGG